MGNRINASTGADTMIGTLVSPPYTPENGGYLEAKQRLSDPQLKEVAEDANEDRDDPDATFQDVNRVPLAMEDVE